MLRDKLLLLIAFAGLALVGGCSSPTASYKYRFAVIPKGLTHEFWQSIERGARRAAADSQAKGIAVEILWDGPRKESDALEQINIVNQMTRMGIHGLVLAPQHSQQMVAPVEAAVAKKLSVVIIDSGLDKEALDKNPDLIVKYVATDNYNGGRIAAERLIKKLQDKKPNAELKLVLFRYAPGSESTERREQGFLDYVEEHNKKAGSTKVNLVETSKYAGATVETAEREAGPLLTQRRNEGLDGIFAVNESATSGMLNAMRKQKLNGKIMLVGFDSSEPLLQAVREGDVEGLVVQDPYRMGYLAVWTLVQHLEGYDVSAGGKNQSTGEHFLTRENMDTEEMRGRFEPAMQAKRTIETPTYRKK